MWEKMKPRLDSREKERSLPTASSLAQQYGIFPKTRNSSVYVYTAVLHSMAQFLSRFSSQDETHNTEYILLPAVMGNIDRLHRYWDPCRRGLQEKGG